jgi:hypothetical protein
MAIRICKLNKVCDYKAKMLKDKIKYFIENFNRKKVNIVFVFLLILFLGYAFGRIAGNHVVSGLLKGKRFVLLFYRPPFEYLKTANLLYSSEELERLEGYYSLLDNKIIDKDLLIDRYKQESELIKPVIIWLLGYSGDKNAVLRFISEEYTNADQRLKNEILKTMKRLNEDYFKNFTASRKINIKNL